MKTPQRIEFEGPFVDDQGRLHTDTGDLWHRAMPREFWTPEARRLFHAAAQAGIIAFDDEADTYTKGEGITKAQLAYWCKLASSLLGIDRGGTTYWKPFEKVFGTRAGVDPMTGEATKASSPLKATLHDIDFTAQARADARREYTAPIDQFFETLKASTNDK